MNYEIDAQSHEYNYLLDDLRETLHRINNFNNEDRRNRLRRCEELIQQIKTIRSAYILELRAMEDADECLRYNDMLKHRNATFKNLLAEFEVKKNEIDREQLNAEAGEMDTLNPDTMQTHQVIAQGDKIQDKTQEAVDRMKKQVAEAEEIGTRTANKMDDQIVQMGGIAETLNDVEYNIKRAQKTAKVMAKNAASDRCIQVLCVAITICIIIVIVLIATNK